MLTVREAATRLGLQTDTVRKLIRQGKIPCIRVLGRAIRLREEDVERLITRGWREPERDGR